MSNVGTSRFMVFKTIGCRHMFGRTAAQSVGADARHRSHVSMGIGSPNLHGLHLGMEFLPLGASGPIVSRIGFGCMSLPVAEPGECVRLLHRAIDAGINLIDTADLYDRGRNEELVGLALQGRRERVVLATKVGNRWRPDASGWDWDPSPAHIMKAVEGSLRRLKTDWIDLYQLHGGTLEDPIDETIAAFEQLKESGKIRCYGISSIRPNVIREWISRSSATSLMTQYSLADRRPEEEVLPLVAERGIGVLARGVLCKGLLCGKQASVYLEHGRDAMAAASAAVHGCSHAGRTPAQTAIRYALHQGEVSSAIVGARTLEQVEDMASTFFSPRLSVEEHRMLSECIPVLRYSDHR